MRCSGRRPRAIPGGHARDEADSSAPMAVAGSPEQLVDLLRAAARTSGGGIGLLKTAQVAHPRAPSRLGAPLRKPAGWLPAARKRQVALLPQGVAIGVLGVQEATNPEGARRDGLSPKETLADRRRRARTEPRGARTRLYGLRRTADHRSGR